MGIRCNDADGSTADFNNAAALRDEPLTAMHWVRNYADTGNTFLSIWNGASNRAWRTSAATGPTNMRCRISSDGADQNSVSSSTTIVTGVWNHMALMYDGVDLDFWLNGVLDATGVPTAGIFASTARLAIGGQEGGGNSSDTEHSDIRVYSRVMTPEEMQTIVAARGHDGIVDGLVFRCLGKEGAPAALVSAVNPKDVSPAGIAFNAGFGTPVPSFISDDAGLSFRRRA